MKKLYSFLSVLAVAALGVNAAPTLHKTVSFTPKHQLKAAEIEAVATAHKLPEVKNVHRIAAPAEDVCDTYSMTFVDFDSTGNGMAEYEGDIKIENFVDGMLQVYGFSGEYPLYGEYDPETGVFAIEPDDLESGQLEDGTNVTIACRIMAFEISGDRASFVETDKTTYDITFNGNGFDTPDDCFLAIVLYNSDTLELLNIYDFFYQLTIEATPWETVGECTFVDGIFGPLANEDNTSEDTDLWEPLTIPGLELQQLATDLNQIRINSYFTMYGGSGHLLIDITDPNRVVVPYQETGLVINPKYGPTSICSISDLLEQDGSPAILNDGEYITLANGEINFEINSIGYIFPNTTAEGMNPGGVYGMKFTKASRLTLPTDFNAGIGNVNVATSDKVEYFNLQGIRIENPTHGLYIRRAGKKVEKVIL